MRELIVKVLRGKGKQVLELAHKYDAVNLAQTQAHDQQQEWDMVFVYLDNHKVGDFLSELESLTDKNLQINLSPHSVFPMHPPASQAAQQITTVTLRSPMEVWLNGLQSIGSWTGFLSYTIASGVVVWIGLFSNVVFLLVAAMLIAPFAGPAMNLAIATASGDFKLLWRNLIRYFASMVLMILVTAAISWAFGLDSATASMESTSEISAMAVLLPLAAGAAGALNLIQASNSSLVSGAAVGLLIAAALAPPAGMSGMALVLGRWDMVSNGVFLLLLQLVGINLSGALVFRFFGLTPSGSRYQRGKAWLSYLSLGFTTLALIGLLIFQFSSSPNYQRSTVSQRSVAQVRQVVEASGLARLVDANMRFTSHTVGQQDTLLGIVYVERKQGVTLTDQEIRQRLQSAIRQKLLEAGFNVQPLISVTVLSQSG